MPQRAAASSPADERQLVAWILLVAVILWGALASPFFAGRLYTFDDLGAFHLPLRWFYAQCLASGDRFDWLPNLFGGFYLTGEGQVGTYHPLHWLLYGWLPFQAAYGLELLASYPLMLAGMYLFLRRRIARRDACLFGALVFTFSSFNLLHFIHPNAVAIVAQLPWLLWAIDVAVRSKHGRQAVAAELAVALLVGSSLLLGYPQYVWFSLLASLALTVYVLCFERDAEVPASRRDRLVIAGRLMVAVGLGVMIGSVQLLATSDSLAASQRQAVDSSFTSSGSLHPLNVVQTVAPYLFATRVVGQNTHELAFYLGAVPLMLIAWWLAHGALRGPGSRFALATLVFGLVALLLACGRYGYVYELQAWLPLVGKFRFPCRYLVLVQLAVAVLAALAFTRLAEMPASQSAAHRRNWPLLLLPAIACIVAAAAPLVWSREYLAPAWLVLLGPVLIALASLLIAWAAGGMRAGLIALIVLTAVDLGTYGLSFPGTRTAKTPPQIMAAVPLSPAADGQRVARTIGDNNQAVSPTANHLLFFGDRQLDGYAALRPARTLDYRRLAVLQAAGVAFVARTPETESIPDLLPVDEQWLAVADTTPRVRLVTKAVMSDDPARALEQIDVGTTAIVDRDLTLDGGAPGQVEMIEDRPGSIRVATTTEGRQLLVVSESYHPGWRAHIDGVPQPVLRVNGDFFGCLVDAGQHDVTFEFSPTSLRAGRFISLAGLLLAGLCAVLGWSGVRGFAR